MRRLNWRKQKGQGLVETAVIVPILIILFLGVIEGGWAILTYLQLYSYSRETARFGAREKVWQPQDPESSWEKMKDHFDEISQGASNDHFTVAGDDPTAAIYFSVYEAWAGFACPVQPCPENCDALTHVYTDDDQRWSYLVDPTWRKHYGLDRPSRDDPETILDQMLADGTRLQCQREKRNVPVDAYSDAAVRVEILYDQPQLLGFPLWGWAGPIPMRVTTQMRISQFGPLQ
jgi:hypothetical protein